MAENGPSDIYSFECFQLAGVREIQVRPHATGSRFEKRQREQRFRGAAEAVHGGAAEFLLPERVSLRGLGSEDSADPGLGLGRSCRSSSSQVHASQR